MSADTRKGVEDAIQAHLRDEHDQAILTGYVVVASGMAPDDSDGYTRYDLLTGGAPWHQTAGLLVYATKCNDDDLERAFCDDEDDQ